jgi:hypothetical protein
VLQLDNIQQVSCVWAHAAALLICISIWLQLMPSTALKLLQAVTQLLLRLSASIGYRRATKREQHSNSTRRPSQVVQFLIEGANEFSMWLPLAAGSLLRCMKLQGWYKAVGERQLLETLAELVQNVRTMLAAAETSMPCAGSHAGLPGCAWK